MRTTLIVLSLALAAAVAPSLSAQQAAGGGANSVSASVRKSWDSAKRNIIESAEQMPEANYSFKPVDTVRTFGQILAHLAGANYVFCAAAKGEKPPHAEDDFEKSATTRAQIMKALAESVAYCDTAYNVDDRKLAETVDQPFNGGKGPRSQALLGNTDHNNEHYGNLVTYFRIKGLVPPSSRR